MSPTEFSTTCHNCKGEVTSWLQKINYSLTPDRAEQGSQTIELSCGCVVDFPEWKVDLKTGRCRIEDFMGNLFIEFMDDEMILEEED